MYYLKNQYRLTKEAIETIEGLGLPCAPYKKSDQTKLHDLVDQFNAMWFHDLVGSYKDGKYTRYQAMHLALTYMLGLPERMDGNRAAEFFRAVATNHTEAYRKMVRDVYETVTPGTEEKYGHAPAIEPESANGGDTKTDWNTELERLSLLREKALNDLRGWLTWKPIPVEIVVTPEDFQDHLSGEYKVAGITPDSYFVISEHEDLDEGEPIPMDAYAYRIDNLPITELLGLAAQVQKAIGKGVGK